MIDRAQYEADRAASGWPVCCAEDMGGSHYHCANCGRVTGMYGCWSNGSFRCEKKEEE